MEFLPGIQLIIHPDLPADRRTGTVAVSGFRMSPYEVTQAEYERLMGINPSNFKVYRFKLNKVLYAVVMAIISQTGQCSPQQS